MLRVTKTRLRSVAIILAALIPLAVLPSDAQATGPATGANVQISTSGRTVQATTTIKASRSTAVSFAGVCVRNSGGTVRDFPLKQSVTLTPSGTTITASQVLSAGTYTYWACVKPAGAWWQFIGSRQTFTVKSTTSSPISTMPVGNLPGWRQTFAEDFTRDTGSGTFPGPYASRWSSYNGFYDTFGKGLYDSSIISTHGGDLDLHVHPVNGVTRVAAPVPLINGSWSGQTYGRYSARFRTDVVSGYKVAWLMWPDSGDWHQGEIDFPESYFNGQIFGFNHCLALPGKNCYWVNSGFSPGSWHTVALEWTPKKLSFIIDNKVVGSTTTNIPTHPMHWVLQTETISQRATTNSAHLLIDWVSIYKYAP